MGYAADRSGRAAGAARADPAAHRGADDRVLRARADARSRALLCRRRWTNWWTCSSSLTTRCPSRLSTCPRSHRTPSRSVRSSSSRSWRNSWWTVPTAVTFVPGNTLFNDRYGHEWVRVDGPTGVYFWNVSSNYTQWGAPGGIHRQPRAVYKYWATRRCAMSSRSWRLVPQVMEEIVEAFQLVR